MRRFRATSAAVAPAPPMVPRARLLAGLAAAGAIPLTVGVVLWIVGTVMRLAYHGRWGATAGLGAALILVGLVCGLMLLVFAADGERRLPTAAVSPEADTQPGATLPPGAGDLVPLASPGQQAFLANRQPPPPVPHPTGPPSADPANPHPPQH